MSRIYFDNVSKLKSVGSESSLTSTQLLEVCGKSESSSKYYKCLECQDTISQLQRDNRKLEGQLLEQSIIFSKTTGNCRCELREKVGALEREESCLLHTIDLKKERLESLKETDKKVSRDLESNQQYLDQKLQTLNDVQVMLQTSDRNFAETCQNLQDKKFQIQEMETSIEKLKSRIKLFEKQQKALVKKENKVALQLSETRKKYRETREENQRQHKILQELETVTSEFQEKIQHFKCHLKMLGESREIHEQEINERKKELDGLNLYKQEQQKLTIQSQNEIMSGKNILKSEIQRNKALEKHLKETENATKILTEKVSALKEGKDNMVKELKDMKIMIKTTSNEIQSSNEKISNLNQIMTEVKENEGNMKTMLIQLAGNEKDKIRMVLDEMQHYSALYKEAIYMKNLLATKHNEIESQILNMKQTEFPSQVDDDLESHHNMLRNMEKYIKNTSYRLEQNSDRSFDHHSTKHLDLGSTKSLSAHTDTVSVDSRGKINQSATIEIHYDSQEDQ